MFHLSSLFFSVLDFLESLLPFFFLLGILVFIHEFGHFIVARYFGVRVEVFSLGFGKKILKWKKGDTLFSVGFIPLGGYVKMFGDQYGAEMSETDKEVSFLHKSLFARTLIVLAGPLMNFLLAVAIFTGMAMVGEERIYPVISSVEQDSMAAKAGFQSEDRILSVNQETINSLRNFKKVIFKNPSKDLDVELERKSGVKEIVRVQPADKETLGLNGFMEKGGVVEGLSYLTSAAVIGVDNSRSLAGQAGFRTFDKILSVDGNSIRTWIQLESFMRKDFLEKEYKFIDLEREGEIKRVQLKTGVAWKREKPLLEFLGIKKPDLFIADLRKGGRAEKAGIQKGDFIFQLNGKSVSDWVVLVDQVRNFDPKKGPLEIQVIRDGQVMEFSMEPEMRRSIVNGQEEKHYMLGIVSGTRSVPVGGSYTIRQLNPLKAMWSGFGKTLQWCALTGIYINKLIQGDVSRKALGGVIQIGREAYKTYSYGLRYFFIIMAILSIQLCLINLLPIPILDGGHLFFYVIEFFKGSPLSMKKMMIAQYIGLCLLLFLFIFTTFNDVDNWLHLW